MVQLNPITNTQTSSVTPTNIDSSQKISTSLPAGTGKVSLFNFKKDSTGVKAATDQKAIVRLYNNISSQMPSFKTILKVAGAVTVVGLGVGVAVYGMPTAMTNLNPFGSGNNNSTGANNTNSKNEPEVDSSKLASSDAKDADLKKPSATETKETIILMGPPTGTV